MALAKGHQPARGRTEDPGHRLSITDNRIQAVSRPGTVRCETVVNAAGMGSDIGRMMGEHSPSLQHQYLVTEAMKSCLPICPPCGTRTASITEVGGLSWALQKGRTLGVKGIPKGFTKELLRRFRSLEPISEGGHQEDALSPIPVCAPGKRSRAFTPDGNCMLGRRRADNCFVASDPTFRDRHRQHSRANAPNGS